MTAAPVPEDVRAVLSDGSTVPCEVAYQGMNPDGLHEWEATATLRLDRVVSLRVARLPARTSITFRGITDNGDNEAGGGGDA